MADEERRARVILTLKDELTDKVGGAKEALDSFVGALAGGALEFASLAGAAAAAAEVIKASIDQAAEEESIVAQLNATLQSTGGSIGMTTGQFEDLALATERTSTFSHDAVLQMDALLARMHTISAENAPQVTAAIVNMATAMGTDLTSAAMIVTRALERPEQASRSLLRAGIVLTAEQREQIKNYVALGESEKAEGIILDELTRRFGGSATAAVHTFRGETAQLKNQIADLEEILGMPLLSVLEPAVEKFTDEVRVLTELAEAGQKGKLSLADLNQVAQDMQGILPNTSAALKLLDTRLGDVGDVVDGTKNRVHATTPEIAALGGNLNSGAESGKEFSQEIRGAVTAIAALHKASEAWNKTVAQDTLTILDGLHLKGAKYTTALDAIDAATGSSLLGQDQYKTQLEGIVAQYQKDGDAAKFETALKNLASEWDPSHVQQQDSYYLALQRVNAELAKVHSVHATVTIDGLEGYGGGGRGGGGGRNAGAGTSATRRAAGGSFAAGNVVTVGERGPEQAVFGTGGQIIPSGGGMDEAFFIRLENAMTASFRSSLQLR